MVLSRRNAYVRFKVPIGAEVAVRIEVTERADHLLLTYKDSDSSLLRRAYFLSTSSTFNLLRILLSCSNGLGTEAQSVSS